MTTPRWKKLAADSIDTALAGDAKGAHILAGAAEMDKLLSEMPGGEAAPPPSE